MTKTAGAKRQPTPAAEAAPAPATKAKGGKAAKAAAPVPAAPPPPPVEAAPARKATGFDKLLKPSPELAAVVGADPLPRAQVVSKVWDHIRAHGLQKADDKRVIVADAALKAVFGKDAVTMFEMNKLLSPHLS